MKIIFEGNIGSGKSFIIKQLTQYLQQKYNFQDEDLSIFDSGFQLFNNPGLPFNILNLAIQKPQTYTFLAQMNFLYYFYELQKRSLKTKKSIQIVSRSIYSVMEVFSKKYFENGFLKKDEYEMLQKNFSQLKNDWFTHEEDLTLVIFVNTDIKLICNNYVEKEKNNISINPFFTKYGLELDYFYQTFFKSNNLVLNLQKAGKKVQQIHVQSDLGTSNNPDYFLPLFKTIDAIYLESLNI